MKKILTVTLVLVLLAALSVSSVGAYVLPKGTAVSRKEGADPESIVAIEVFGFVGDADFNGKVNIRDATDIQKYVASIITLSDIGVKLSDVDFSGSVNVRDATAIQKWIANFETEAPVYHTLYSTDDEAQVEMIIGNWVAVVNLAEELNAQFSGQNGQGINFKQVDTSLHLTFNENGTYKINIDQEDVEETVANFKAGYAEGMTEYLEAFIKENNLATTVEGIVKSSGYNSMEEMVEKIVNEDTVRNLLSEYSKEGRYSVNGNTFYLSDSVDEGAQLKNIAYYDFSDVNLIITGGNGLVSQKLHPAEFIITD